MVGTVSLSSFLTEVSFLLACVFVLLASCPNRFTIGDFSDGNIPPGLVPGNSFVVRSFRDNHCRTLLVASFAQRSSEFLCCKGTLGPSAQAGGIRDEIDGQGLTVICVATSQPVLRSHAIVTTASAKATDAGEAMVIDEHDIELEPFLN